MNKMKRIITSAVVGMSSVAFGLTGLASAAPSYSLFGEASTVSPGNGSATAVQTVSDSDPGYGGVSFTVPSGTTLADIGTLSTDYNITEGNCGLGSPRFVLGTAAGNIFVYLGAYPNYTNCTTDAWVSSGDLLESGMYLDTSQVGGTFYDTYDNAITTLGSTQITSVELVTDAGYAFGGNQTVLFDNVNVDGTVYDFEPMLTNPTTKDDCKNGGWKTFTGSTFKNQGDCVSFVATKGKNMPAMSNNPTF